MMKLFTKTYSDSLRKHYESYFGKKGARKDWTIGPTEKLHSDFYVLEIAPNKVHNMWTYLTVGMSLDRTDKNLIELFVHSPEQSDSIVELLTLNASFHRNSDFLNLHHTVNIGQPWLNNSICDHGFISLPYLDGEKLELFKYEKKTIHCYWLIPITEKERDFKSDNDCESLERLFEDKQLDYLNPNRKCLIEN
jgi:hypothetical protein